ncbi:hypothetical protein IW256_005662 [Actinomadura viridis]|uniref:Ig-like domain-containing protein n=1 Tax=Actinomadura viridis TaxID=58110 RepID=A0A931GT39_9ACTN|nr:hypothetical protein [Actinomadura viridis]
MTDQLEAPARGAHPADPADLFIRLYDSLPDRRFQGWEATMWYDDPAVRRQAEEIAEIVLALGSLDPEVTGEIIEAEGDRGRFAILLGLDGALAHANPYGPYHDAPALSGVLIRYLTEGRFNADERDGALLPRCAFPGRPRGRRAKAEFFGVHRIPPEAWARVDHTVLPAVHDAHFNRDEPVNVACAPVLETFDDIEIGFERRYGMTVYRLRPKDSRTLRNRIEKTVRRLDEAGAQIAVMPEVSLSDELLEHWKEVAFETAGRDRDRHPLRFIMLGSGPLGGGDPPPNRAVLLDRWTGRELLVQDKLSGFTLDAGQMRLWRLPGAPSAGTADEYLAPGATIALLDMALGRLAVLICEDLSRSIGWERELLSCGVSHLLVPIFSKPILRYRWEQQGAERQIATLGSWTTVSNSLVIGTVIPPDELEGTRYTCLVAGPEGLDRLTYAGNVQFARAEAGDEPALLDPAEDGSRALPTVLPGAAYDLWHDHWTAP